jgi:hypothetical protein
VCSNPKKHLAHDTCPGRKRHEKIARPVDANISAALDAVYRTFGAHSMQADPEILGILSASDIAVYGLELEAYEKVPYKQKDKFMSFFTAVKRTNAIILDYAAQNLLPLTLRQIHYQMVVRHREDFPNTKTSYDHLNIDLVDARLAGLVPWNAIDDPTRDVHQFVGWASVQAHLLSVASYHHLNRWENQEYRPIVLVEKDAALGIISRVCDDLDVPYVSLKGYGSVTALRNKVAQHCRVAFDRYKVPVVIHLSDHDASGWDMPRSLQEYLDLLVGRRVDMRHIALTLDQIAKGYGDGEPLPSDPVKSTDPRAKKYIEHLGERGLESGAWEMDALPPADLHNLIADEIKSLRDEDKWNEVEAREQEQREQLRETAGRWNDPLPCIGESA